MEGEEGGGGMKWRERYDEGSDGEDEAEVEGGDDRFDFLRCQIHKWRHRLDEEKEAEEEEEEEEGRGRKREWSPPEIK